MSERKTIWICQICGKTGTSRMTTGDESCYLWSILVYEDSINLQDRTAEAVETGIKSGSLDTTHETLLRL